MDASASRIRGDVEDNGILIRDENLDQDRGRGAADETQPLLQHRSMASTSEVMAEASPDNTMVRRVLKKIDRTIIPLLFVTYMLNFMDKTILSSAAVFGLLEDNVCDTSTVAQEVYR